MQTISQTVQVTFRYQVCFSDGLFQPGNPLLRDTVAGEGTPRKLLFVLDAGVATHHPHLPAAIAAYCQHYADALTLVCPPIIVPGGEPVKHDPSHVAAIQQAVNHYGICRHSYIVVVGGGAVIDMAGYAAATSHRGVRLIRVPTTVLAQNDSAVGVKNSVNAFGKKNFLGTFAPPYAVLNDASFLATLEDRDWCGGIAEAVKVALLKDSQFFAYLEQHAAALARRELAPMRHVIYRCAQLHLDHIASSGDAFEQGSSRPLDFGHWAAHKLEALTNYRLRHGEAVAIGIALDSTYAYLSGMLPHADWQRILELFCRLGLHVYDPALSQYLTTGDDPRCVLSGLREFREHLGGQLTIMLLNSIGCGAEVYAIDENRMRQSIRLLEAYQRDHDACWDLVTPRSLAPAAA